MVHPSRRKFLGSIGYAVAAPALSASGWDSKGLAAQTPAQAGSKGSSNALLAYFQQVGPKLLRPADGYLKYPSLSPSLPGKTYSAELWDWDTLWTARGLLRLATLSKDKQMFDTYCEHAKGSLNDFLDHQSDEGRLPIQVSAKSADFFGSLAKVNPNPHNQAKPVMAQLALLVADATGDVTWIKERFDAILRFHDSWRKSNSSPTGLLVWGNDVAIGMDNDPTTFGRPPFSSASVMLNSFFYKDVQAAAELAKRLGRTADHQRLNQQAESTAAAIQKHCWDRRDNFYYTVDVQCKDQRSQWLPGLGQGMAMTWNSIPLRIQTAAGFMPLWCGIATRQQAKALIETNYLADDRLRASFGVRTLSNLEPMYSLEAHSGNPSNWLGPVWIITNYLVWVALNNYGYTAQARELADKTVSLLTADLNANGTLNEYYHPDSGAALSHSGFVDWNLLVLEMV